MIRLPIRILFLLVLLTVVHAPAQSPLAIRGVVLDPTGAPVTGAAIRLQSPDGNVLSETHTDATGVFNFAGQSRGSYTLFVPPFSGFGSRTVPIRVTAATAALKISLLPDSVSQEVNVAPAEDVATDSASNRDTVSISASELRKLPVFDQDPIAALSPFLDAASGSSGGATIIVDGVEMKSAGVSASAIQEVRINNDPYSAEFNRPGRGRVEIITKPGSPQFHGEANFTFRDAIFNAKNYFAPVRPPEARRIYEGHLSGPVGHGGHTSFITSGSRREQDTAVTVNAVGPSGPIIQNVLTPNREQQYNLRFTHDFSANHRLSVGYNFENSSRHNAGVGGIVLPEAGYNSSGREDDAIFNDRIIITPNLINQLQVALERDEDTITSVTNAQSIQVNGSFIGGGAQMDEERSENTIHVTEIVTWSHKNHYIRFGVQLPQFSRRATDDHNNRLGTFKFASLANFATSTPYVFTSQQGLGRGIYWINEFGSFFQDQIKLSPRLQLTLGLRYDWQTFLPDNNNLGPRVSLAYAPGKGKTILRVGAGAFYDRTGGDFPTTVKIHDGIALHSIQLDNPADPLPPNTNFAAIPTNIVRFDPHVRAPYAFQYSFGIERQLPGKSTITAGYRGQVQIGSFRSRDVNAPILPHNPSLTGVYPRPNASLGQVQVIESEGRNILNALDVSFRGKASRWFSGQAQYTLSRFDTNTTGINGFPPDQYKPSDNWGRSDQDRLHRLIILGNMNPDHWLSIGIAANLTSGAPYNETTGADDFHTGIANARPVGVPRNSLQGGGLATLDLLYDREFTLTKDKGDNARVFSAGISAFNVLNHTNYASYIGNLTSPLFRQPTGANPGRQIQMAVGFRF